MALTFGWGSLLQTQNQHLELEFGQNETISFRIRTFIHCSIMITFFFT